VILVIGGTGQVGSRLLQQLSNAAASDVKVLVRSEAAAAPVREMGLTPVSGDLARPQTLGEAFVGVRRVFLLTPYSDDQAALEHAALDAAETAGVERVVYLSLIGADVDLAFSAAHRGTEARLAASRFAVTVLRPDFFAQNLLGQLDYIRQGQLIFPAGAAAVAAVDVRDIAEAAAAALTAERQSTGTFALTGPQRLTFAEMAARIGRAVGWNVQHVDVPLEAWHQGLLSAGVPALFADGYAQMFRVYQQTGGTSATHGVSLLTQRTPRSLDTFLHDELVPSLNGEDTVPAPS